MASQSHTQPSGAVEPLVSRPKDAPLKVLLFSPLPGRDHLSGDTSYSDALLSDPPPGVVYTTYAEALTEGSIVARGQKPWQYYNSPIDAGLLALRALETAGRRSRVLFREPLWFVTIEPGQFDLIHQHLFGVCQIGKRIPVVSSAGYPLHVLYEVRNGWSNRRSQVALVAEAMITKLTGTHQPWLKPTPGNIMTVYSEHFRSWLLNRGVEKETVRVISTAAPDLQLAPHRSNGKTLAVIARDFWRKGGDVAVEAFTQLHKIDPELRLIVATTADNDNAELRTTPGVELFIDQPRSRILEDILPQVDILLVPTRLDCGAPYAMLEALQQGCGVVTSDIPWLDDRLLPPAVMRVGTEPAAVAHAAKTMLADLANVQTAARNLWATEFAMKGLHEELLDAYYKVVGVSDRSDL